MTSKSVGHKNGSIFMERTSTSFASRAHNRYRSITNKDEGPLTDD